MIKRNKLMVTPDMIGKQVRLTWDKRSTEYRGAWTVFGATSNYFELVRNDSTQLLRWAQTGQYIHNPDPGNTLISVEVIGD